MQIFNKNTNKNNIHLIFLFILSLNYIIPLILFGNITLFSLDALDSEIPYNFIIGKFISGNQDAVKAFINGEIDYKFLRRIYHPYSVFYSIFRLESAYWIIDILVKFTSYISFFTLSKKISKNNFLSALISCLYASSNLPTHEGFGLAILPYIFYLAIFKNEIKIKHYFILIFFGLNSDFIFTAFALPILILVMFLLSKKKKFHILKINLIFIFSLIISNNNLFFIDFQNIELHREEFARTTNSFLESLIFFFKKLFNFPTSWNFVFFKKLPYTIFYIPLVVVSIFSKDKKVKMIFYILILTLFLLTLINTHLIGNLINQSNGLVRKLSWDYISTSFNMLFCLIALHSIKNSNNPKLLPLFFIVSIGFFQINSSIVPFYKQKILKTENYQNIYTFKGYYFFYDYKKIKKIVKNERVLSVGLDPMVAIINDLKVIDGYHSIYPLSYKKKFRKIIEQELEANSYFKNYYDSWGSRLYTTLYKPINENNIKLNFTAAKNLGTKFVISKYKLNSKLLSLIYDDCENGNICLYKIN